MKKLLLCFFAINLAFFYSTLPALADEPAKLLISKVQIVGADGQTGHDLIEIYNPNDFSVPLSGYRLVKRSQTGDADYSIKSWQGDITIAGRSYHIWASSDDGFADSINADSSTSASLAADNAVAIRFGAMDSGAVIDAIGWGEAANALVENAPYPANPEAGQSLIRSNLTDTNNNSADFALDPPAAAEPISQTPSSGSAEITDNLPTIYINEIYPAPESGENEWIELYLSSGDASLDGFYLEEESGSRTHLSGRASGYYLIDQISGNLNNDGDKITLYSADGRKLSSLSYGKTEDAAIEAPDKGLSISRLSDNNYALTAPSPGRANDTATKRSATQPKKQSDIIISEILANPVGADLYAGEFIELYNRAGHSVSIGNWQIRNQAGQTYEIEKTAYLKAKSYRLLRRDKTKLALNNLSEELSLFNQEGRLMDKISLPKSPEGQSYALSDNSRFVWSLAATPGKTNKIIPPNQEPKAVFAAPAEINTMTPVYLDASDSMDPENGPLWYEWDLGDGRQSKQLAPEIIYKKPGNYQLKLTVFDGQAKSSQIKTVKVLGDATVSSAVEEQTIVKSERLTLADNQPSTSEPEGSYIYGVVAAPPGLAAKQYFYLLPMAENGDMDSQCIQVYNYEAEFSDIKTGDYLRLQGELYEISSGWRLKIQSPSDLSTLDEDYILIEKNIAIGQAQAHLNHLVSLTGRLINCSSKSCVLSDGLNEINLDIKEQSGIDASALATGIEYRAAGIVRQVRDSVKLLLRQPSDLIPVSNQPPALTNNQEEVINNLPAGNIEFAKTESKPWQDYALPLALGLNVFFIGRLLAARKK